MSWTFRSGRLTSPRGLSWPARSGNSSSAALPKGTYTIGRATGIDSAANPGCRDANGFAWWCPLTANFRTTRTRLGIHPDGGDPGTAGCVGITCADTRPCYDALGSTGNRTLEVG